MKEKKETLKQIIDAVTQDEVIDFLLEYCTSFIAIYDSQQNESLYQE